MADGSDEKRLRRSLYATRRGAADTGSTKAKDPFPPDSRTTPDGGDYKDGRFDTSMTPKMYKRTTPKD